MQQQKQPKHSNWFADTLQWRWISSRCMQISMNRWQISYRIFEWTDPNKMVSADSNRFKSIQTTSRGINCFFVLFHVAFFKFLFHFVSFAAITDHLSCVQVNIYRFHGILTWWAIFLDEKLLWDHLSKQVATLCVFFFHYNLTKIQLIQFGFLSSTAKMTGSFVAVGLSFRIKKLFGNRKVFFCAKWCWTLTKQS